jgi:ankyrin repeat protein
LTYLFIYLQDGSTPLIWAVRDNQMSIAFALLQAGADQAICIAVRNTLFLR